jgi:hypothetical protein
MTGIQHYPLMNSALTSGAHVEEAHMRRAAGVPDRETIRATVADKDLFPTAELFQKVAEEQGIDDISVKLGNRHFADYATPPGYARGRSACVSIRTCPTTHSALAPGKSEPCG